MVLIYSHWTKKWPINNKRAFASPLHHFWNVWAPKDKCLSRNGGCRSCGSRFQSEGTAAVAARRQGDHWRKWKKWGREENGTRTGRPLQGAVGARSFIQRTVVAAEDTQSSFCFCRISCDVESELERGARAVRRLFLWSLKSRYYVLMSLRRKHS